MEGCEISKTLKNTEESHKVYPVKIPDRSKKKLLFLIRLRKKLKDLPIYSAFFTENQDSLVFVEAKNLNAIKEAIQGLRYATVLSEPVDPDKIDSYLEAFKVKYKKKPEEEEEILQPGAAVRINKGPLSGKKARVVSVRKDKVWVDLGGGGGGGAQLVEIESDNVKLLPPEETS